MLSSGLTRQRGFSLVELMLASALSLSLLAAVSNAVVSQLTSSGEHLKQARLHGELSAALDLIVRELRRAGYWADNAADPRHNPFTQADTALGVFGGGACVLYSYDRNRNGRLDDERFGFRLRQGAIEVRSDGSGCNDGGWQKLTDHTLIRVDELRFEGRQARLPGVGGLTLTQPAVTIWLRASLRHDPHTWLQLTASVTPGNASVDGG